jgi:2-iminobutanoate/2-iminopropanoate deaminase
MSAPARRARSIEVPRIGHKAPIPLGARVGNLICSSGIAGKDPASGALPADGALQVEHAFANMKALLAAGGATLADVVRLSVTLADDALREAVNTHWLSCFPDPADRPARHVVVHPLAHGMALQLELLAVVQDR